ncbi:hypothetical protein [Halorubrum salipaludis]|nr:hypothetical protein [Halorubrum salipaludis]
MERRTYLAIVGTVGATSLTGCTGQSGSDESDDPDTQPESSTSDESSDSASGTDTEQTSVADDEETCETIEESSQELLIDRSYELPSEGSTVESSFAIEEEDRIAFDIDSRNQQEIDLTIESPIGGSEFEGTVTEFSNEVGFSTSGDGRLIMTNVGTVTNEQRTEIWSDTDTLSAGEYYSGWITLNQGDSVDYFIRQLGDGARPKLVIENENRDILEEEAVAAVIDDEFTAPDDGEYYFRWENTATLTSGNWRWEFEAVSQDVVPADVSVTVERKFTEETEVCE